MHLVLGNMIHWMNTLVQFSYVPTENGGIHVLIGVWVCILMLIVMPCLNHACSLREDDGDACDHLTTSLHSVVMALLMIRFHGVVDASDVHD